MSKYAKKQEHSLTCSANRGRIFARWLKICKLPSFEKRLPPAANEPLRWRLGVRHSIRSAFGYKTKTSFDGLINSQLFIKIHSVYLEKEQNMEIMNQFKYVKSNTIWLA
jgi:hypothetical protein